LGARVGNPKATRGLLLSAAEALLLWLGLLYYFRGFKTTGILVRTVLQITLDIK
jgi:hypothetical protein